MANAVEDGFKVLGLEDLTKGNMLAVYTDVPKDNFGLPFWLGKLIQIERPPRGGDGDESAEESGEEEYGRVKVLEYNQRGSREDVGTGKYDPHLTAAAPARGGQKKVSPKQVTRWLSAASVAYSFGPLTKDGSIRKKDLGEIAYKCEIAGKCQDGVPLCGVEELNTSLGFKTLP